MISHKSMETNTISIETDEDRVTLSHVLDGQALGYVVIDRVFNGHDEFIDYMDEDMYDTIFGRDDFYKIEHIESLNKGSGSILMNAAINYVKDNNGISIYLNACPVKHKAMSVIQLVRFYSKFNFKIIDATDLWDNNKEMVLRLNN